MENIQLKKPVFQKFRTIVSFWENTVHPVDGPTGSFQKRYYSSENKAREFVNSLVNSGRNVTAIELKIIYKVEVK